MAKKWYWCGRGRTTVLKEGKKWGTESEGADCSTSTNSTFSDTRFHWQTKISLLFKSDYKANNVFVCDTLIYQSRFKCQIIRDLFHNMPLKSKLKNFCCPPTNIIYENE